LTEVGRAFGVDPGKLVVGLERIVGGPEKLEAAPGKVVGLADGTGLVGHLGVAR
jgi:hypothetical protein